MPDEAAAPLQKRSGDVARAPVEATQQWKSANRTAIARRRGAYDQICFA
jgi:hypothetical protein